MITAKTRHDDHAFCLQEGGTHQYPLLLLRLIRWMLANTSIRPVMALMWDDPTGRIWRHLPRPNLHPADRRALAQVATVRKSAGIDYMQARRGLASRLSMAPRLARLCSRRVSRLAGVEIAICNDGANGECVGDRLSAALERYG